MRNFGTEGRVKEDYKKIPANPQVMPFVTFPGNEIKDLSVFESDESKATEESAQPTPAKSERTERPARQDHTNANHSNSSYNRPQNNQQSSGRGGGRQQNTQQSSGEGGGRGGRHGGRGQNSYQNNGGGRSQQQAPREYTQAPRNSSRQGASAGGDKQQSSAGTGEHLTHLRLRKVEGGKDSDDVEELRKEFDFSAGLSTFNKTEVLATVASESAAISETKYVKDDFFDSLSNDAAGGARTAFNSGAERQLNQDTFGAIAVQQSNFRRGGYRGGGRGGGGRSSGGRGYRGGGRGGGRGSYGQDKASSSNQ